MSEGKVEGQQALGCLPRFDGWICLSRGLKSEKQFDMCLRDKWLLHMTRLRMLSMLDEKI